MSLQHGSDRAIYLVGCCRVLFGLFASTTVRSGHYGMVGLSGMSTDTTDKCHHCHVSCRDWWEVRSTLQILNDGIVGIGGNPNHRLKICARISR